MFSRRLLSIILVAAGHAEAIAQSGDAVTYADVAPLFAERCVMCHAGPAAPLGLALDSYEAIVRGSSNGPVAIAGDHW